MRYRYAVDDEEDYLVIEADEHIEQLESLHGSVASDEELGIEVRTNPIAPHNMDTLRPSTNKGTPGRTTYARSAESRLREVQRKGLTAKF